MLLKLSGPTPIGVQNAMDEDELKQVRDDARCDMAVQTLKDVLWRFEETAEGTYSIYDLIGYVVEDLVKEGCCAACINESLAAASGNYAPPSFNPFDRLTDVDAELSAEQQFGGGSVLAEWKVGDLMAFRRHELAMALNRLRSLRLD